MLFWRGMHQGTSFQQINGISVQPPGEFLPRVSIEQYQHLPFLPCMRCLKTRSKITINVLRSQQNEGWKSYEKCCLSIGQSKQNSLIWKIKLRDIVVVLLRREFVEIANKTSLKIGQNVGGSVDDVITVMMVMITWKCLKNFTSWWHGWL